MASSFALECLQNSAILSIVSLLYVHNTDLWIFAIELCLLRTRIILIVLCLASRTWLPHLRVSSLRTYIPLRCCLEKLYSSLLLLTSTCLGERLISGVVGICAFKSRSSRSNVSNARANDIWAMQNRAFTSYDRPPIDSLCRLSLTGICSPSEDIVHSQWRGTMSTNSA